MFLMKIRKANVTKVEIARVRIVGDETRKVKRRSVGSYYWTDLVRIWASPVSEIRGIGGF